MGQCVDNTVALVAESLVQGGREIEAEALTASRSGPDAERKVLQLAQNLEDEPVSPVLFLADVVRLGRGGRPELADEAPTTEVGGPTPAALEANLGFVCAHIAAQLAGQESAGAMTSRSRARGSASRPGSPRSYNSSADWAANRCAVRALRLGGLDLAVLGRR